MVLRNGEHIAPFWGKALTTSIGRDQLGIQASSLAAYSTMLPGITNQTNRIRYYGFYCWLIDTAFRGRHDVSKDKQITLIRRAEILMALLMVKYDPEAKYIAGSRHAKKIKPSTIYNIAEESKHYWRFNTGIFGQYYYGAMEDMSLVFREKGIVACTDKEHNEDMVSGVELAIAFSSSLDPNARDLFLNCLREGMVKDEDLKTLYDNFSLTKIIKDSEEYKLYEKILLQRDSLSSETFFRKSTIYFLLNSSITDTENTIDIFKNHIFEDREKNYNGKEDIANMWFYYQLNEYWHYACESILWAFLLKLYNLTSVPINTFIDELTNTACNSYTSTLKDKIASLTADNFENKVYGLLKLRNSDDVLEYSFDWLLQLYQHSYDDISTLTKLKDDYGLTRSWDCIDGLNLIHESLNMPYREFVRLMLLKNIVNLHLTTSFRKMDEKTGKNVQKFCIDDGYFHFLEFTVPEYTSPRLKALISMLTDMQYIDEDQNLTDSGKLILNQIRQ